MFCDVYLIDVTLWGVRKQNEEKQAIRKKSSVVTTPETNSKMAAGTLKSDVEINP